MDTGSYGDFAAVQSIFRVTEPHASEALLNAHFAFLMVALLTKVMLGKERSKALLLKSEIVEPASNSMVSPF